MCRAQNAIEHRLGVRRFGMLGKLLAPVADIVKRDPRNLLTFDYLSNQSSSSSLTSTLNSIGTGLGNIEAGSNTADISSPGAQAAAAINIAALMAATGVGVLTDIAAAGSAAADSAQLTFQTAHYAARPDTLGVSVVNAEAAVSESLPTILANLTGITWGRLTVDNVLL